MATLLENMVRSIDTLDLTDNFSLRVGPTRFYGPEAALFHNTNRLAHFEIQTEKFEMRVSYMARNKMGRIHSNFAYVPLAVPGTIERIQDMIRKAVRVYSKWLANFSKFTKKPQSEVKQKPKRFAHRPR
jgi:hypothetical protein